MSRYHHVLHYHPAFLAGIGVLGLQSVLLTLGALLSPLLPGMAPWVLGLWLVKAAIEHVGMGVGTAQWGRRDLWGLTTLWWSLLHPAFIATAAAVMYLRRHRPELDRPFTTPLVWLIAPAAILGCVYLFTSLTAKTIVFFFAWNAVGVVVYLIYGRGRSNLATAR